MNEFNSSVRVYSKEPGNDGVVGNGVRLDRDQSSLTPLPEEESDV